MYTVTTDQQSGPQIAALPPQALAPFAELHATLEVAPWNGRTQHRMHPASSMRTMAFGPGSEGLAYYLILDDLRRVDLLSVVWVELPSI